MTQFDNILQDYEITRGLRGYLEADLSDDVIKRTIAAILEASEKGGSDFTNAFNVALAARYRQLTDAADGYQSPFTISLEWAILDAARLRALSELEGIVFDCQAKEDAARLRSVRFILDNIVDNFAEHLGKYLEKRAEKKLREALDDSLRELNGSDPAVMPESARGRLEAIFGNGEEPKTKTAKEVFLTVLAAYNAADEAKNAAHNINEDPDVAQFMTDYREACARFREALNRANEAVAALD